MITKMEFSLKLSVDDATYLKRLLEQDMSRAEKWLLKRLLEQDMSRAEKWLLKRLLEQDMSRAEKWLLSQQASDEERAQAQADYATAERLLRQY